MTALVIWIRHGTCRDGLERPDAHARPDSPLTAQGAVQVQQAAAALTNRGRRPALILTSPLPRALDTARLLSRAWHVPVALPDADFSEWRAPDCVLGKSANQYPPAYQVWRARRDHDTEAALPGGESLRDFADRSKRARDSARAFVGTLGTIAVVSHRVLIGGIVAQSSGHSLPAHLFAQASGFQLAPANWWFEHVPLTHPASEVRTA